MKKRKDSPLQGLSPSRVMKGAKFSALSSLLFLVLLSTSLALPLRTCSQQEDCATNEQCQFTYDCQGGDCRKSHGLCFQSEEDPLAEVQASFMQVSESVSLASSSSSSSRSAGTMGGMNVTSLAVTASPGHAASVVLGDGETLYKLTASEDGSFNILQGVNSLLTIDKTGNVLAKTRSMEAGSLSLGGNLLVQGVRQWRLVAQEDFSRQPVQGWTNGTTSQCGGMSLLGGYCKFSQGEVTKQFFGLSEHTQLRIVATYHFIDSWEGEAGFMRVNNGKGGAMEYAWTENYNQGSVLNAINICGNHHTEGRFSSPIDVIIPHTDSSVVVGFGSTLDQDPCDESFGVSGVQLYVR